MRNGTVAIILALVFTVAGCGDDGGNGGDDQTSPVVGTWVVDAEKYADVMMELMKDAPPETRDREKLKEAAKIEVHVKADGTWNADGSMGAKQINESGTWKLDGDQLTIDWTMKDGKEADWTQTVKFDGTSFVVKPDKAMPFEVTMVRK